MSTCGRALVRFVTSQRWFVQIGYHVMCSTYHDMLLLCSLLLALRIAAVLATCLSPNECSISLRCYEMLHANYFVMLTAYNLQSNGYLFLLVLVYFMCLTYEIHLIDVWICDHCVHTCMDMWPLCTYLYGYVTIVYILVWICDHCVHTCMDMWPLCTYLYGYVTIVYILVWICDHCVHTCMDMWPLCTYLYGYVTIVYILVWICDHCVHTCKLMCASKIFFAE